MSATLVAETGRSLCSSAASASAMRPCGTGGTALVRCLQPRSGNAVFVIDPIRCGAGILMRCSSASTARHITYGAPLTMKAKFLRFWPRNGGTVKAALRFLKRAMKRYGRPATIVTDRLQSYRAAMKVIGNEGCQETRRWLNNRAENSHLPFRRRERAMAKFREVKNSAEIRLRPCFDPQPLQPPTPSQPPRYFQTRASRCAGRVVSTCSLKVLN